MDNTRMILGIMLSTSTSRALSVEHIDVVDVETNKTDVANSYGTTKVITRR